jgi:hypothetical protein
LPVPLSPCTSTVARLGATRRSNASSSTLRGLSATIASGA